MTNFRIFSWTAIVAPILAVVAPLSTAPVLAFAAVAIAGSTLWRHKRLPTIWFGPAVLFSAFVIWGAISLVWTPAPLRGSVTAVRLTLMFVAGLALCSAAMELAPSEKQWLGRYIAAGVFCALTLIGIETLTSGMINGAIRRALNLYQFTPSALNNSVVVASVFFWPTLIALDQWGGRNSLLLGLLFGVPVLISSESTTVAVAMIFGVVVFIPFLVDRGTVFIRRLVVATVLLSVIFAPLSSFRFFPLQISDLAHSRLSSLTYSSLMHRFYIWDFVTDKIYQKPILGWGLESSTVMPGSRLKILPSAAQTEFERLESGYKSSRLPLHPHNAVLQIWLELGLVGILMLGAMIAWLFSLMKRVIQRPVYMGLCLAQIVTIYAIANASYGIWQSWWLSTILLGAVFSTILLSRPVRDLH